MSNKKVLVVEDDDDVRLGYHILFKASSYDTCLAADGLSAVSEALKYRPDLTILDLGLPAGDGFTVLEHFRASRYLSTIPVIVVSGHAGTRDRALQAGARAHFSKPWNDYELLTTMARLLGLPDELVHPKWDLDVRTVRRSAGR